MGRRQTLHRCYHLAQYRTMRTAIPATIVVLLTTLGNSEGAEASCPAVLPGWASPADGQPAHVYGVNIITMVEGKSRWNGVPVDEGKVATYVKLAAKMTPPPFLVFDPQGSNCDDATRMRDLIDQNYPCRDGACGQGDARGCQ